MYTSWPAKEAGCHWTRSFKDPMANKRTLETSHVGCVSGETTTVISRGELEAHLLSSINYLEERRWKERRVWRLVREQPPRFSVNTLYRGISKFHDSARFSSIGVLGQVWIKGFSKETCLRYESNNSRFFNDFTVIINLDILNCQNAASVRFETNTVSNMIIFDTRMKYRFNVWLIRYPKNFYTVLRKIETLNNCSNKDFLKWRKWLQ